MSDCKQESPDLSRQKQTITEDGRGNCYATCIACLLGVPVDEVPNFVEQPDMHASAREWLKGRGYGLAEIYFNGDLRDLYFNECGYCIVSGKGPRRNADGNPKWHAVIGHAQGWGVELRHDPHPENTFLHPEASEFFVYFLRKL